MSFLSWAVEPLLRSEFVYGQVWGQINSLSANLNLEGNEFCADRFCEEGSTW